MVMYTTLETVKNEMGIDPSDTSNDNKLERKIKVYSDLFDQMTGRSFSYAESFTEMVAQPSGRRKLILPQTPVHSIKKIELEGSEIDADSYFLEDGSVGHISKTTGTWVGTDAGAANIQRRPKVQPIARYVVTYEKGYVTSKQAEDDGSLERTLPYDIEDAVISAVVSGFQQSGVDSSVSSISVGDASTSWDTGDNGMGRQVPEYFTSVAKRYSKITVL